MAEGNGGGLADRQFRFRAVVIILVGVLGFVLGALYLSVERMAVTHHVVATGSGELSPGEPAALRVSALQQRGHTALSAQVAGGRWVDAQGEETALALDVEGTRPAAVRFQVPAGADGPATVQLDLRVAQPGGGDAERTFPIPVTVAAAADVSVAAPAPAEPVGEGGLRVTLLPEVRVLSWRFDGPLFARVTDATGAPVAARVELRIGKDEVRTGHAGALGIAAFPIKADQPRYQFHARATDESGRHGEVEEDLRPVPRAHRLLTLPAVVPPGGRYRLELTALEREETVHCDVARGGRIRDSFTLRVSRGNAAVERQAPPVPGRYAVQCAPYFRTPGEGFATRVLVVSAAASSASPGGAGDPVLALIGAVEPKDDVDAHWLEAVRRVAGTLDGEGRRQLEGYLLARLTPDYAPSVHLASTLEGDTEALRVERAGVRGKLLLALGIALTALLLWALFLVGSNLRDVRRRSAAMSEVLAEDDDSASVMTFDPDDPDAPTTDPPPASFARVRSRVQYVVIAVLLIANLIGILWLLGVVIR